MSSAKPHPDRREASRRDPLALGVVVLAGVVLLWKLALTAALAAAPDARTVWGTAGSVHSGIRATQVLLEEYRPGAVVVHRRLLSGDPPDRAAWSSSQTVRKPHEMLNLVRSYGYAQSSLLITLDDAGRVLRVQPAPAQLLSRLRLEQERSTAR